MAHFFLQVPKISVAAYFALCNKGSSQSRDWRVSPMFFRIFLERADGLVIEAFQYRGTAAFGIERARREAAERGIKAVRIWAEAA